jgi:hypothetical protein
MFGKWDRRFLFLDLDTLSMSYGKKPNSTDRSLLPIQNILRVKQDLGFSKKGKVVVLYAIKRLFWMQFESNTDMNTFLKIFSQIYHARDELPLYIKENPVSQLYL